MKKLLALILSLTVIILPCSLSVTNATNASTANATKKISAALKEKLTTLSPTDEIEVYLWFSDIDHDQVEKEVKEKIGISSEDMQDLSDSIYETYCNEKGITLSTLRSGNHTADEKEWAEITRDVREEVNEKVDNYIQTKREISAEKQLKKNKDILSALKISEENRLFESKYSPMNIVKVTGAELAEILKSNSVLYADLYVEEEFIDYSSSELELKSQAMGYHKTVMGNNPNLTYDGSGVKIGQLENYIPNISNTYEFGNSDITKLSILDIESEHASRVASIMVGTYGFSPDAELYVKAVGFTVYSSVEDLISAGVTIINQSFGDEREDDYYTAEEKWIDHISVAHNVAIVQAAGNVSNFNSTKLGVLAIAYNVITVGNAKMVDYYSNNTYWPRPSTNYLLYDSCYYNSTSCEKPDVVASGCNYPYITADGSLVGPIASGTSFSAPVVTGISACLMEQNPTLKTEPILLKAILMASCKQTTTDETWGVFNVMQGAGIVNKGTAQMIVQYSMFHIGSTFSNEIQISTPSVAGTSTKSFALAWEKKNMIGSNHTNESLSYEFAINNLNLEVYNAQTALLLKSSTKPNSSTEFVGMSNSVTNLYARITTSDNLALPVRYALAWHF